MIRHTLRPYPSPFPLLRRLPKTRQPPPHRTLIAAPSPSSGPLMSRRPDRALPSLPNSSRLWLRTIPVFALICTLSALAIFNYQKASSSIVNSTLYALRTSPRAREYLGDEVYFRDRVPWIWGTMNQVQGRVDIGFGVKGTRGRGWMRFRSERRGRMGYFETQEWSLETEDGRVIQLLEEERVDPFKNTALRAEVKEVPA